MRYILTLLISTVFLNSAIGQREPKLNDEKFIKTLKIKSLSTFYYDKEETEKAIKRLLFKKEFDNLGNLISKYHLSLWDEVSYDHTTTYSYDKDNNLVEEKIIQKILNLGKRDKDFIKEMGDDPINERFVYFYNGNNQILKKENYSFGKEGFNKTQKPDNTVNYEYVNGLLAKEISTTPNGMVIYQNYIATYDYNPLNQKIRETKIFNTIANKPKSVTNWTYNEKGLIIEMKIDDKSGPFNIKHIKYEYDQNGKLIKELQFSIEKNKWENLKLYAYDKSGNLILGDAETTFDYYENGLVRRELWKSSKSGETVNFITTYKFQ